MFEILKSVTKAAIGVATLPVTTVVDTLTLGGQLTDRRESYTGETLRKIKENIDDATD